jgi:hypothetical protein
MMGKRVFSVSGFGKGSGAVAQDTRERMDRVEAARELEIRALIESDTPIPGAGGETFRQRAERLGVDRSALANASKFMELMGGKTPATARHGAAAPIEVGGERFRSTDSWTDSSGDTHTEAYRPVGGGRFERVIVTEERVSERTRLVTRSRGGR